MKPKTFKTEQEVRWYVEGLKDAKKVFSSSIDIEIRRYLDGIPFMEFKE